MKYKVGDEVRTSNKTVVGQIYDECGFTEDMEKFKGKTCKITKAYMTTRGYARYEIDIDAGRWCWANEMLEPVKPKVYVLFEK